MLPCGDVGLVKEKNSLYLTDNIFPLAKRRHALI